ncbi:MAG: bifunctional tRNA (5-methylaminomethyl-2-thiouridine)(34)-methyltransferase MnmD/FAD-dependent 5-carboxymethylaminomethyl-2-thiouridine(34) oxidoreductase MnmC [Betaproteobacteria bacterium]|nr:bifunctional tRNA (5-methylaminomethyl-2-thiouridine)(34)-methyltransferase MnmD/FAD-dependent 5-carboxymethylaminomethyl-2-thiouridine(34) oxidoreductase MnmC [Betaproteobacteria bacterium]
MPLQPARLEFASDGTPFSADYGDVYHSAHGGPAQALHVFLAGNDLPGRWQGRDRFVILETGFGLGLNFLATWQAWRTDPRRCRRLHFVSCEKHPFAAADLAAAQRAWPEFAELAAQLQAHWPPLTQGIHRIHLDGRRVVLTLVFGDAAVALRGLDLAADGFFLDGFAPARNPELWSPDLCRALARLAAPGATLATWSVAGAVRAALEAAEFDLERRPGFAGKREMLAGRFRSRRPQRHAAPVDRRAMVIGAGIAGCTAAHALAAAGWQVSVLDAAGEPAAGASGNLAGVLRPLPSADDNRLSRLTRAGFLATRALLGELPGVLWSACGVLHLGREPVQEAQQRRTVETLGWPPDLVRFVSREEASRLAGLAVGTGGWHFPGGGWVQPASLARAALAAFPERVDFRPNVAVDRLERSNSNWLAQAADGQVIAEAPVAVIAAGTAATRLAPLAWLPQRAARGQVSHLPAAATPALDLVVCKLGYVAPAVDGCRLAGATLQIGDDDPAVRIADHAENLARLELMLPGFASGIDPAALSGRTGFRPMSPDRLPIVGAVPVAGPPATGTRLAALPRLPGLWCVQGFGARGIVWSALMADLLLSRIEGEPLPLENDLVEALDPGRFLPGMARRRPGKSGDAG